MPNYNIYYFVIKPLQINTATGRSGATLSSPGASNPAVQRIMTKFKTDLIELMNNSKRYIPHRPSRRQTINVLEIPAVTGTPTTPNFSGLRIQMHEPIVYFTNRTLSQRPSSPVDRSPEHVMLDAIDAARSQEFPRQWVRDSRSVLNSLGEHHGLALAGLPDISSPVTASVFSNSRQNWEATNWEELLAYNLASAAFHEIAHCKLETRSRSNNARWAKAINDPTLPAGSRYNSIHDVPGVSVLASNGVGRSAATADYRLMGQHMLCPINFYRLDQNINNQCFRRGRAVTLTPR
ncbi:MAG: hypothetical protein HND52_02425 [Ignavibacteriae bacterium]|nr:hypothetical protein [Ignavibacteriota bacterium]NOG96805.1 hypothetical protein [Ignavibacteriota bacterium]